MLTSKEQDWVKQILEYVQKSRPEIKSLNDEIFNFWEGLEYGKTAEETAEGYLLALDYLEAVDFWTTLIDFY